MSRYDFSLKVAEVFGLETHNIVPVLTSELGQPAKRPLKAGMKCDRLVETLNWNLRGATEGLTDLKATQLI